MKPGDLVKQAPNVFIDITVADKKMLVLEVLPTGSFAGVAKRVGAAGGASVRTLLEGKKRWWHYEELEVVSEAR